MTLQERFREAVRRLEVLAEQCVPFALETHHLKHVEVPALTAASARPPTDPTEAERLAMRVTAVAARLQELDRIADAGLEAKRRINIELDLLAALAWAEADRGAPAGLLAPPESRTQPWTN